MRNIKLTKEWVTTTLEFDLEQKKAIWTAGLKTRSSEQAQIHQMNLHLSWFYGKQQIDKRIPTKHLWVWLRAIEKHPEWIKQTKKLVTNWYQ